MERKKLKKASIIISMILVLCLALSPFSVYAASNNAYKDLKVYLGGMPFGVKIQTEGVSIQGLCEVISNGRKFEPAKDAGLELFDKITVVNGKKIYFAKDITDILAESQGKAEITYIRNDKEYTVNFSAVLDDKDNKYKCGLILKDTAAGIGTVTFIDPQSNTFAGLGHGIYDMGSHKLISCREGSIEKVKIIGIVKGLPGAPGEIRGTFSGGKCGEFITNVDEGVYGHFDILPECTDNEDLINIASKDQIKEGKAYIYCTLDDAEPQKYEIEIEKILDHEAKTKNFLIHVTDEKLLSESGGIIQGMSGSPIVQNGKLVGAVTHVLINDPTHGYGIFIENMLDKMGAISK